MDNVLQIFVIFLSVFDFVFYFKDMDLLVGNLFDIIDEIEGCWLKNICVLLFEMCIFIRFDFRLN